MPPTDSSYGTRAAGAGQHNPARAPWGHSIAAHALFGGCSHCPARTVEWELVRWREWATVRGVAAWPDVERAAKARSG